MFDIRFQLNDERQKEAPRRVKKTAESGPLKVFSAVFYPLRCCTAWKPFRLFRVFRGSKMPAL